MAVVSHPVQLAICHLYFSRHFKAISCSDLLLLGSPFKPFSSPQYNLERVRGGRRLAKGGEGRGNGERDECLGKVT